MSSMLNPVLLGGAGGGAIGGAATGGAATGGPFSVLATPLVSVLGGGFPSSCRGGCRDIFKAYMPGVSTKVRGPPRPGWWWWCCGSIRSKVGGGGGRILFRMGIEPRKLGIASWGECSG